MQVVEMPCRECGEEVSTDAAQCPKCGKDSPHEMPAKESSLWGNLQSAGVVILISAVALTVFAC